MPSGKVAVTLREWKLGASVIILVYYIFRVLLAARYM